MTPQMVKLPAAAARNYRQLKQKKFRLLEKKFLVEGIRSVGEVLSSGWDVEAVILREAALASHLGPARGNADTRWYVAGERELNAISDTVTSQGIVAVVHIPHQTPFRDWIRRKGPLLIVALDTVADPGNAGTIIRTCEWFGAGAVVQDERTVEPYNPKVVRSAMGSLFRLPVFSVTGLAGELREAKANGFIIIGTTIGGGKSSAGYRFPERCILVLGSEAHGVSPEIDSMVNDRIMIGRFGGAESLNVAIACGVVLYEWRRGVGG